MIQGNNFWFLKTGFLEYICVLIFKRVNLNRNSIQKPQQPFIFPASFSLDSESENTP